MMPIRDRMPTTRFPLVTVVLILINIVVFGWQMLILGGGGEEALQQAVTTWGVAVTAGWRSASSDLASLSFGPNSI